MLFVTFVYKNISIFKLVHQRVWHNKITAWNYVIQVSDYHQPTITAKTANEKQIEWHRTTIYCTIELDDKFLVY